MVWGGNRYVEIFVGGGGANPKKVPQMKKKQQIAPPPPPPTWLKNVPNIEKNAAKSSSHGGKVAKRRYIRTEKAHKWRKM